MLLAVAGCVAQAEGDEILRRAPQVDIVFGPQTYHRLPELVASAARAGAKREGGGRGVLDIDFPAESKFDPLPAEAPEPGPATLASVTEGSAGRRVGHRWCHHVRVRWGGHSY